MKCCFMCLNHYKTYSTELQWNCAPSTMIVLPVPCLLSQLSWLHTLLCMIWTTRIVTYGMNTSKNFIKMFHLLFLQLCENVSIVILISPIYRSRIVQLRIHVDIVYTISSGSHGLRFSTRFKACSYQRLLTNLCRFESVQS